jgi:hypothetical protein
MAHGFFYRFGICLVAGGTGLIAQSPPIANNPRPEDPIASMHLLTAAMATFGDQSISAGNRLAEAGLMLLPC